MASYLLHYHGIRLLAPLSTIFKGNPGKVRLSVLRIQPPATIDTGDIASVVGLREVCRIIRANHEYCLIAHIVGSTCRSRSAPSRPGSPPAILCRRRAAISMPAPASWSIPRAWSTWSSITSPPPAAWFPEAALHRWWTSVCRFLEPQNVYHSLVKSHGFVVENSLVFVPYLPDYLVDTEDPKLVQEIRDKIQDAVTIARELGDDNIPVGMVGLGAYTSIVTQNGTTLNDYEVSVTSGNTYTVALTLLGLLRGAEEQGIDRAGFAAVVGATGNIGLVLAQFLVLTVDRLLLVGRDRDGQRKLGYARLACVETLLAPSGTS